MQKGSHSTNGRMAKGTALERAVRQVYENQGFTVIHSGLPDLFCVRGTEIVWVECKAGRSTLRPHQKQVVRLLKKLGLTVVIQSDSKPIFVPSPGEVREYLPLTGSSYRIR